MSTTVYEIHDRTDPGFRLRVLVGLDGVEVTVDDPKHEQYVSVGLEDAEALDLADALRHAHETAAGRAGTSGG